MKAHIEAVSVSKAAELADMTPGQVSNMIFHGPITPQYHVPDGTGDQAMLGRRNVKELMLISKMRKAGLKQDTIRGIIELLAVSSMKWWEGAGNYVVVVKDKWFVTDNVQLDVKKLNSEFILLFRLD